MIAQRTPPSSLFAPEVDKQESVSFYVGTSDTQRTSGTDSSSCIKHTLAWPLENVSCRCSKIIQFPLVRLIFWLTRLHFPFQLRHPLFCWYDPILALLPTPCPESSPLIIHLPPVPFPAAHSPSLCFPHERVDPLRLPHRHDES